MVPKESETIRLLHDENKRLSDAVDRLMAENATQRRLLEEIKTCLVMDERSLDGFDARSAVFKVTADLHVLKDYFRTFKSKLMSIKAHCQSGTTTRAHSIVDDLLKRL